VVTDRKVLDQQLENTIYQFEHKTGVAQKIDRDSSQLASALGSGTKHHYYRPYRNFLL
jgi:type I restriction enzyme R subunit